METQHVENHAELSTAIEKKPKEKFVQIKDEEVRPRLPIGSFMLNLVSISALAFLVVIGLETFILDQFSAHEVNLARKLAVLSFGGALIGATLAMIVGFGMSMKRHFNYKHAAIVMGTFLALVLLGFAIVGRSPFFFA